MSFEPLKLDNRTFQDIVDELKTRIPRYCPEWTDHNVSDPGVTLIELFAYVADQLIYRMNQMPALHYQRFAEFLGVPIPTAQPVCAPMTFWLSKPLAFTQGETHGEEIWIKKNTQVATTQTEFDAPLIFSVTERTRIVAPYLVSVFSPSNESGAPLLDLLRSDVNTSMAMFSAIPKVNDYFDFHFDNDISRHVLRLNLELEDKVGTDILIDNPPIEWQAYTENHAWETINAGDVHDTTKGLNTSGSIELHLPNMTRLTARPNAGKFGVRVRVSRQEYGQSPRLRTISSVASLGRTIDTYHLQEEINEVLGISNGSPGQRFQLSKPSIILPLKENERLQVGHGGSKPDEWEYVERFSWPGNAGASPARCFSIDVSTNEVCLPPAIRQADGEIRLYGAIPERGATISFSRYRYGGSEINLKQRSLNVLKSSIPYIDRVENRRPVFGGQDAVSSIEGLRAEVQRFLRLAPQKQPYVAITGEDYENLIREHYPEVVGRVECKTERIPIENSEQRYQGEAITVCVYVIAKIPLAHLQFGALSVQDLTLDEGAIERMNQTLYERRLLAARVRVVAPQIIPVDVTVALIGSDTEMEDAVRNRLSAYLHPIYGGSKGEGWPLNEPFSEDLIRTYLRATVPNIELTSIELTLADRTGGAEPKQEDAQGRPEVAKLYIMQECFVNVE